MIKISFQTWAIIILAAAFGLYILFDKDPEPNAEKIQALKTGLAIADQKIIKLTADSTKLANRIKQDAIRQENEKITYQATIKKQSDQIANLKANPIVVKIREETLEVDSLLDAMEAKDSIQSERIAVLENDLKGLRVDMAAVNFNCGEMLQAEREQFNLQESLTKEYKSQNRKLRRGAKWLKAGIIAAAVGGLFIGSK